MEASAVQKMVMRLGMVIKRGTILVKKSLFKVLPSHSEGLLATIKRTHRRGDLLDMPGVFCYLLLSLQFRR